MQKLLIATHNKGKIKELSQLLSGLNIQLVTLNDLNIDKDVREDGKTYKENSQKKALFYAKESGLPALADDGGLEIAALGGAPGIKSKRWIGEDTTEDDLVKHMIKIAQELPDDDREAAFRTVVSFALPTDEVWSSEGKVLGMETSLYLLANGHQ